MVFLHEGLGCIEMWRDFPALLCAASGRAGIVFDRRGYGGSDGFKGKWPLDYLIHEGKTALPAVLDALGIQKAVLFGHSDGGTIALMAAALAPERVVAGITEAAHIFVEDITLDGIRRAVNLYETTDLKARLEKYHGKNTGHGVLAVGRHLAGPGISLLEHGRPAARNPPALFGDPGRGGRIRHRNQVRGICQGVSGKAEPLIIPDCGHIPHAAAPDAVLQAAVDFLARHGG